MNSVILILCLGVVAVTAVPDPLQHVLQEVEQLKRNNELMQHKIESLENQLEMKKPIIPKLGENVY